MTSLWMALGFPLHSTFDSGTYNDHVHSETVGLGTMDIDHGAMKLLHLPSAPRLSTIPTLPERDEDSGSDDFFRLGLEIV